MTADELARARSAVDRLAAALRALSVASEGGSFASRAAGVGVASALHAAAIVAAVRHSIVERRSGWPAQRRAAAELAARRARSGDATPPALPQQLRLRLFP